MTAPTAPLPRLASVDPLCRWCVLWPAEARELILTAAREGREHGLGNQCRWCRLVEWDLRSLNVLTREIAATSAAGTSLPDAHKEAPVRG